MSRDKMWRRMSKVREVQENDAVFLLSQSDTFNEMYFLDDLKIIQGIHGDQPDQIQHVDRSVTVSSHN